MKIPVTRTCLECGDRLVPQKNARGLPPRFCSASHKTKFNNRACKRGAHAFHLYSAIRRERDKATEMKLVTALSQLEIAWHDEDVAEGRTIPSHKPPEMTLWDIALLERCIPTTNLYIRN